ncbi:hypothetical protein BSZ37_12195 [Rubrivirga marina]|uniref:FlgD Ig-like domain-containing protein n=1 Tax=Rubrivirga marina TaxID=1196024 RepID=A0A271J0Z8_9BACT|nr:hypothetical protein BSZ37_12195 [Rubrivirga marina]
MTTDRAPRPSDRPVLRPLASLVVLALAAPALAQGGSDIPAGIRGEETSIARGILDGNLIETNFRNQGELSRYDDAPWGVWPRGIGGRHIDGVGVMVAGQVPGERSDYPQFYGGAPDTTLNPVILNYREAGRRLGPRGNLWGWLPLPGFHNPNRLDPFTGARNPTPALSDDPTSWPNSWPDRLSNPDDPGWAGFWNGFFGKGVFNADLEGFYVIDDLSDHEYLIDPQTGAPYSPYGVFDPIPSDPLAGGLGLQTKVRLFQWANVLAEDLMFVLYRITNVGQHNHDRLYFAQAQDYGLGTEEGDENAAFDPLQDVAYGWDQDGLCTRTTGGQYECGYTGFAFLESPTLQADALDNDQDGMTDELRFGGAGALIEGQAQIQAAAAAAYNLPLFEAAYSPITQRPAYEAGRWWTGDENMDWVGFEDTNGNGMPDPGEPVNNDVGRDGLGPFDLGYPGPDDGESDGMPTPGEPNFDELDIDESDQVGLTGFDLGTRPFYENGDNLRSDTWLFDRIINYAQFELGTPAADFQADIEPFLLFVSGPVPLAPGETSFFSTAWIFGANEADFFKNRRTAQNIYNADYNFAQPPFTPTLTAVPGDGRVVLSWDTLAIASYDRFSQEFDFEGFRLYKGTDPLLTDARLITDVNGTPTFYRPMAQWDLDNDISGGVSVLEGEASYNVGSNSGLQFYYVDENVTNGVTYYYALVAYDRGFRDPDNPNAAPIDPQENTFNFTVNQAGALTGISQNAAVVTPRAPAAGYVAGAANEDLSRVAEGIGTGSGNVEVVSTEALEDGAVYRVTFHSEYLENSELYETTGYSVTQVGTGEVLVDRADLSPTTPYLDGFVFQMNNDAESDIDPRRTGWRGTGSNGNTAYSLNPGSLNGVSTEWGAVIGRDSTGLGARTPWDYQLRWVDAADSLYSPPRAVGFLRTPIPIYAVNASKNELIELLPRDIDGDGEFGVGDELVIAEAPPSGVGRRYVYVVRFTGDGAAPAPGTVFQVGVTRPFFEGDFFQFSLRGASIDMDAAQAEMERIAVVPNPYIGTSIYEPRSQIEGRGERRVQFIHLPQRCTIRIYTIRGELVRTIEHDGIASDGSEAWNLRTEGNEDVAYGIYLYHVEAPGVGEYVGRLALVK